jgi:WD40 repeat protein
MATDAQAVAEKAKAFAQSTTEDAIAKAKLASEAKLVAEKAIDEVAAKSFAVGQMKPLFDKLTAETPEKIKQATDKLTSASNALVSAEKEFKKAEQSKASADHELQLAKTAAQQATDTVAQSKTAIELAEAEQKRTEGQTENAKKTLAASQKPIRAIAFSPANLVLATTGDDHKVHTWSAETGAAFETYPSTAGRLTNAVENATTETNQLFALAFGPAHTLLAASLDGLTVWDLNPAWKLERTLGTGGADSPLVDRVNTVRFSTDGQWLATGGGEPSRSGEIILWNAATGRIEQEFRNAHSDTVLALDFSPDGKYLASGAADRFVKVIDLTNNKVVKSFEGHLHHVLGVSWKRDGRTLASSGADNVVKIWDFVTGERKKNIEGFSKEVTSVAFIDATDQALTSSGDNQIRLVRENGDSVRTFSGATDYVYSAMATPDGKIVVAGGQDSMLRVWSGMDGKEIVNFPPPQAK